MVLLRSFRRHTFFSKRCLALLRPMCRQTQFQKFFVFLQQTYRHTFCLKNCFARVLPICNQSWFKSVAGAFAINFHTKPFVKKQVVGSFAANLQADTMSQTKQPFLAHQAATTPAMASTGSQKNKRTKAPLSKKVGHNTLINR